MSNTFNDEQKEALMTYDKIDSDIKNLQDQIKPIQLQIRELKTEKNVIKEKLLRLVPEEITCNLPDVSYRDPSIIKFSKVEITRPLSKESMKENLFKFFKDNFDDEFIDMSPMDKTNYLFDFITNKENRDKTLKLNIRRIKKKNN